MFLWASVGRYFLSDIMLAVLLMFKPYEILQALNNNLQRLRANQHRHFLKPFPGSKYTP